MINLYNHKTFLLIKNYQSLFVRRTMITSKAEAALFKKIGESVSPKIIKASMSFHTLNKAEKHPKDPTAILKNPPIGKTKFKHKEIRKTKCDKKICPPNKLCGLHKTVGNPTHGTKNTPYGTTYNLDPSADYNGNPRAQNANFYKASHDAHITQEDSQGTAFLNQPHVIKEIQKHEK